ncbi:hypothetical protein BDW74DRAFT_33712 [Aspergillus multicolor]|uniref:uncharacterized protein n=1 Tax=Aspergillus multicolor TaxID=41759 RepID=UPI003CCCC109
MADLVDLDQPIALRPEYSAQKRTALHVKQFDNRGIKNPGDDLSVWKWPVDKHEKYHPDERKLFSAKDASGFFSQRRCLRTASGTPLYNLALTKLGVTWFVHPADSDAPWGSEAGNIATIAPRWNPLKNKFDVYVKNVAADGKEVLLKIRGQGWTRSRVHGYVDGALVMDAERIDDRHSVVELEWKVEVTGGLDLSLVSAIMIVLCYMSALGMTGASTYHGAEGFKQLGNI